MPENARSRKALESEEKEAEGMCRDRWVYLQSSNLLSRSGSERRSRRGSRRGEVEVGSIGGETSDAWISAAEEVVDEVAAKFGAIAASGASRPASAAALEVPAPE